MWFFYTIILQRCYLTSYDTRSQGLDPTLVHLISTLSFNATIRRIQGITWFPYVLCRWHIIGATNMLYYLMDKTWWSNMFAVFEIHWLSVVLSIACSLTPHIGMLCNNFVITWLVIDHCHLITLVKVLQEEDGLQSLEGTQQLGVCLYLMGHPLTIDVTCMGQRFCENDIS